MVVNEKKSNVIIFNRTHKFQALPFISLSGQAPLSVVCEMKLLGITLDHKLTWWPMIEDLVARSRKKLWALVRLKEHGASRDELCASYVLRIRSILEYACPAWGSLISDKQANRLEAVQRQATNLILGDEASSYKKNLDKLTLTTLGQRRIDLTKTFAIKAFKSYRFSSWFKHSPPPQRVTKIDQSRLVMPRLKTVGAEKSPIMYFTRLLNDMSDEELGLKLPPLLRKKVDIPDHE